MPKTKLDKETSAKFADFLKLREAAKDASNAENRQKTVIKNVFKSGIKNQQFQVGTYVLADGFRFDYSQTETEVIEPSDFFALYEKKQITREQFLKCISVRKGDVDTHVGSDVSLQLARSKIGKDFDVRVKMLDIDAPAERVMVTPDSQKPIVRSRIRPKASVSATAAKPTIRRVKIKK